MSTEIFSILSYRRRLSSIFWQKTVHHASNCFCLFNMILGELIIPFSWIKILFRICEAQPYKLSIFVVGVRVYLYCTATELSLSRKFWNVSELSLMAICNGNSCMQFFVQLSTGRRSYQWTIPRFGSRECCHYILLAYSHLWIKKTMVARVLRFFAIVL